MSSKSIESAMARRPPMPSDSDEDLDIPQIKPELDSGIMPSTEGAMARHPPIKPEVWEEENLRFPQIEPEVWEEENLRFPQIEPEVWERYEKQVEESEGFDIDRFPGIDGLHEFIKPLFFKEGDKTVNEFLELAIEQQNQKEKEKVKGGRLIELERIIKLNARVLPLPDLYYTFEARDVNDGTKRTFQAMVAIVPGKGVEVGTFREKASSTV